MLLLLIKIPKGKTERKLNLWHTLSENYFERKEREEEETWIPSKGAMGLKSQSGETLLDSYRLEPSV